MEEKQNNKGVYSGLNDEQLPNGTFTNTAAELLNSPDAQERMKHMTAEEKRRMVTESHLAGDKDYMNQLVDRLATNSFQG